jgi:integrase
MSRDGAIYYRDTRGTGRERQVRFWLAGDRGFRADFRAFADVQGGLEALIVPGERAATRDPVVAQRLAQERLDALVARREARRDGRVLEDPRLADYLDTHLTQKAERRITASTIDRDRLSLENLLAFAGAGVCLSGLDVRALRAFVRQRRGDGLAEQTILNELHAFSNLWMYAKAEGLVTGDNPVKAVKALERVERSPSDAVWLETGEAVRLLAAATALAAAPHGTRSLAALVATFLYTGGRKQEILGLERGDVDLAEGYVHIQPNRWRGLKSRHSRRRVPLWPALRRILEAQLGGLPPTGALLFPSHRHRTERPYVELDGALAAVVAHANIDKPVTLHTLRHTYTAHRLCTLEGGAPVSVWDVACELGHRDTGMIERVYGHVLRDRDRRGLRRDGVEYVVAKVLPFATGRA